MDINMYKKKMNLLDLQKELARNGELVNSQTTQTHSENKFGNILIDHGIKVISNFMLDGKQFDFRILDYPILIEIDGGVHAEIERRRKDYAKDRAAVIRGFKVLRFTNQEVDNTQAIVSTIRAVMRGIGRQPRIVYVYPLGIIEQIQFWYWRKIHKSYNLSKKFQWLIDEENKVNRSDNSKYIN